MRFLGLLLVGAFMAAQQPEAQAPTAKAIGSVKELMASVLTPTSDAVFYIATRVPENDVEWSALRTQTLILAESANLLMMPGRARDQDKWMKDAELLLKAGTAAFEAAKRKDVDALVELNEKLYEACVMCHQDYRPGYRKRL
jgi:hypothetical protein